MEARFQDDRLRQLYDYWRSKCGGRPAPDRTEIDLVEIARLLPILHMVEVTWAPLRFRYRLVGTATVEAMGRDVTGRYLDRTLYGDATDEIVASVEAVAREARPYHRTAHLDWHEHSWLEMEAVDLPLLGDDDRVAAILCGASFRQREARYTERLIHIPLTARDDGNGAPPAATG